MGHAARGTIWIPPEEWYAFVAQYAPQSEGEIAYGPPSQDANGDIAVEYAINTECHPAEESKPPEWLKRRP